MVLFVKTLLMMSFYEDYEDYHEEAKYVLNVNTPRSYTTKMGS